MWMKRKTSQQFVFLFPPQLFFPPWKGWCRSYLLHMWHAIFCMYLGRRWNLIFDIVISLTTLEDCLKDPLQLWPTCVGARGGMRVHRYSSGVCCAQVRLKRALAGRRECEKLAVLTALEQFQGSAGAGGCVHIWVSCRGEKRVGGEVDIWGWDEAKGFQGHKNDTW